MTRESTIESYFVKRVNAEGGISLKTDKVPGRRFIDRTAWLPGGVVITAELKRPVDGRYSAHQIETLKRLSDMGHIVWRLKNKEEVDACFAHYGFGR